MRRSLAFASALALATGCTGSAAAPAASAIVGGEVGGHEAIVVVESPDAVCAGVLVARRYVLSSRTCLHQPRQPLPFIGDVTIYLDPGGPTERRVHPVEIHVGRTPMYTSVGELYARNYALHELEVDVEDIAPLPLARVTAAETLVGTTASAEGRGYTVSATPPDPPFALHRREVTIDGFTEGHYFVGPAFCTHDGALVSPDGALLGMPIGFVGEDCETGMGAIDALEADDLAWIDRAMDVAADDAGTEADAGRTEDAAPPAPDASTPPSVPTSGCACRATAQRPSRAGLSVVVLVLVLTARRRRR